MAADAKRFPFLSPDSELLLPMRNTLLLVVALVLTVLCWGMYGPVLQKGQLGMAVELGQVARLRPFVCVGLAYFLIGVIVPMLWLHFRGEKGEWSIKGIIWSLAGGALGAIEALGIILAFTFGGKPIYVMPLVFGGAGCECIFDNLSGAADERNRTAISRWAHRYGDRRCDRAPRGTARAASCVDSGSECGSDNGGHRLEMGLPIACDCAGDCELGVLRTSSAHRSVRDASQPVAAAIVRRAGLLPDRGHRAVFLPRRDGRGKHLPEPRHRLGIGRWSVRSCWRWASSWPSTSAAGPCL